MKTEWDYTALADAYLKRPDYSDEGIDAMLKTANIFKNANICDIGAGAAHLTLKLLERGMNVHAVEPNDAMRANGMKRTIKYSNIKWFEGTGENTGQPSDFFDMVTFGSSFNVTNRQSALAESSRILKKDGWFACMWNHRLLSDPIQAEIEKIIKKNITNYEYGSRREEQAAIINKSGLFSDVKIIEATVNHNQPIIDCIEAWKSHATLQRQAKEHFSKIIFEIEFFLKSLKCEEISVPYTTKIWMAQLKVK